MPMLISCFDTITDNRVTGRTTYDIKHALLFVVLALLSNAKSYRAIAVFIEERRKHLCKFFGVKWKKSPAHNTIRDILHSVTAEELEKSFRSHATQLDSAMAQVKTGKQIKHIAFDGKALCGSIDPSIDKRFIQLLSGFSVEGKIILCHYEIDEKSNEIPALQKLIGELGLKGILITGDAMHCQKKLLK